jgi:hypothetical protein
VDACPRRVHFVIGPYRKELALRRLCCLRRRSAVPRLLEQGSSAPRSPFLVPLVVEDQRERHSQCDADDDNRRDERGHLVSHNGTLGAAPW